MSKAVAKYFKDVRSKIYISLHPYFQRMMVEMEEMASRPFSSITVEIDRKYSQIGAEKKETDLRKRKKVRLFTDKILKLIFVIETYYFTLV